MALTIKIPGVVYYDTLDPMCSGMAEELGLPEPRIIRRGRGATMLYEGITPEQAEHVADYIDGRAWTLLGQGWGPYDPDEQRERAIYRKAIAAAREIRKQLAPQ